MCSHSHVRAGPNFNIQITEVLAGEYIVRSSSMMPRKTAKDIRQKKCAGGGSGMFGMFLSPPKLSSQCRLTDACYRLAGGLDTHRASYRGDRSESSTSTDIGSGITRAGRKRGKGDSDGIGSCRPMSVPRLSLAAGQDGAETSGSSGESGSDTSSITSLQDVLGLEGFADLSDGRNTCLKRVDQPGDESEGNPAKGSKVVDRFFSSVYLTVGRLRVD